MPDNINNLNKKYSLNPPQKCDYYKKILVEEIVLMPNLYDLHYGDCAVIGKIRKEANGDIYLENIKTTYLEKEYWLSEGALAIKIWDNLIKENLPHGKTVELYGQIILFDKINTENNEIPINSADIHVKLLDFINTEIYKDPNKNVEILKKLFNENLKKLYEPAIQLRFMHIVDVAHELIESNLQIRILCEFNKSI